MSLHHTHKPTKKLLIILVLTFIYMIAEAIGGVASNSLSLLADAGHMFADVTAVCISLVGFYISAKPATNKSTYGFYRAEVLAALLNGLVLLLTAFFIIKEAIIRLFEPAIIESNSMLLIAFGGLIVNIISLWLLHKDQKHNLNLQAAFLHVLSDALGSVAVIFSGILIYFFNITWFDQIASIAICVLITFSALSLIYKTLNVLMEQVPDHIDITAVKQAIISISGVINVHDLHIWSITLGQEALSAHVLVKKEEIDNKQEILENIQNTLLHKFSIHHITIQIEYKCTDNHWKL